LRRQPTFGLWDVALRDDLRAALDGGVRKIVEWTDRHGAVAVGFAAVDGQDPFFNVNTPGDLLRAARMAGAGPALFGVTGWKNSGKTGLMERLVNELTGRGLTISTVKHAHHSFDVDHPGRDSFRHRQAGATEVLLVSRNRWALMHELRGAEEPPLVDLLDKLAPADLVLIEGYKTNPHPKIEAHREATRQALIAPQDLSIVAVASDSVGAVEPLSGARPVFDLDDTVGIADFILERSAGA
jgi:molybdopterin-guanine dinucleotide biosynthesis protein MobB